jgi:REP element-mobilizing transposase RayT
MDREEPRFFNPYADIGHTENRLPHWQQAGAVYFVTFRLADSVPKELLDGIEEERELWLRLHPQPWTPTLEREYHERFTGAVERRLDAGHGSCVLRHPECRAQVAGALRFFEGKRCAQIAWVVMPNHVHALFVLHEEWTLEKLLQSWKRHSAREINKRTGRTGEAVWQKDYFDRLVRDAGHLANCVRYIRRNPIKARFHEGEYELWESDLAKAVESTRRGDLESPIETAKEGRFPIAVSKQDDALEMTRVGGSFWVGD